MEASSCARAQINARLETAIEKSMFGPTALFSPTATTSSRRTRDHTTCVLLALAINSPGLRLSSIRKALLQRNFLETRLFCSKALVRRIAFDELSKRRHHRSASR